MEENEKKNNRTGDIHLRCYPEDKDFLRQRSKDGFGRDENSMTNVMLYALRHVDDTSPITLSFVDELIRVISQSRQTLDLVHADIVGVSGEMNAVGNNINQIAKAINTILKIAREEGEDARQTIKQMLTFQGEVQHSIKELSSIMDRYEQNIRSARTRINSCLRKEDDLLTKTLVHPRVGKAQLLEAQLLRLLEEYIGHDQYRFDSMNVTNLLFELRGKVKASLEEGKDNKERR